MVRRRAAGFLVAAALAWLPGCRELDPLPPYSARSTPPYYYLLFPALRAGQNRPTPPGNLRAIFEPLRENIALSWTSGIDPDSQLPAFIHRIYVFIGGPPPEDIYHFRYLFDETFGFAYNIDATAFTGDVYFVVTSYDGAAESLPSNSARVNIVTGEVSVP